MSAIRDRSDGHDRWSRWLPSDTDLCVTDSSMRRRVRAEGCRRPPLYGRKKRTSRTRALSMLHLVVDLERTESEYSPFFFEQLQCSVKTIKSALPKKHKRNTLAHVSCLTKVPIIIRRCICSLIKNTRIYTRSIFFSLALLCTPSPPLSLSLLFVQELTVCAKAD